MLRVLVFVGNLALVALFAGAFAARFVHPRWGWWFQVLALGMPLLTLLVTGAGAGWALSGRWGLAAAHLALALLIVPRYAALGSGSGPDDAPELRVVTFNAKAEYLGPEGPEAMETLLDPEPHILALQGAGMRVGAAGSIAADRALLPLLQHDDYEVALPAAPNGALRLLVFTRLPWLGAEHPYQEDEQEGGTRLSTAEVEWQGAVVTVINVHLESFGERRPWRGRWRHRLSPAEWARTLRDSRAAFMQRADDAGRVRELVEEAGDRPVIVAGDLNSTPHQWSYWHIARGLTDTAVARRRAFVSTYHARFPLVRIDHILVSRHWHVREHTVHRQPVSDHRPVSASLALRDAAALQAVRGTVSYVPDAAHPRRLPR